MPEILVPDTSVLVDGRITQLVQSEYPDARVLVPLAALSELEAQANRGMETGFTGLDELTHLHELAKTGGASVEFVGRRPTAEEIDRADTGAVDALIRDAALEVGGLFVTSDRVQAHAAAAHGVRHHYVRPIVEETPDLTHLEIWGFFEDDIMSVHLKSDCVPMVKRGQPGRVVYEPKGTKEMAHPKLRNIARECIEFAKRDYQSFVELQRHGCTVVQLGPMRITIAQPPFSDGLEITAVRPITRTTIDDYDLPADILQRIEGKARGVFVAGPPGSGKSTFAAAVAEHLHGLARVVKTMEAPRDLQVPKEITQYGPLDHDMAWTGEVMLLVRPDHVVYDEVRTTGDYKVFADMRLAGIGLFGVTHANRAIDAVQRLLGRVDLGMIPQIVDTVVFVDGGRIGQILELTFTVRVPAGMTQEDLARPVVVVRDLGTGKEVYELYTYGEQIVVMPLEEVAARAGAGHGAPAASAAEIKRALGRYARGHLEVEARGGRAVVYAEDSEIPSLIGKGGRTVQMLEKRLGIRLDIKPLREAPDDPAPGPIASGRPPGGPTTPYLRKTGKNVFLQLGPDDGGRTFRVEVEGALVGDAKASQQGKIRFKAASPEGRTLIQAEKKGLGITCTPLD